MYCKFRPGQPHVDRDMSDKAKCHIRYQVSLARSHPSFSVPSAHCALEMLGALKPLLLLPWKQYCRSFPSFNRQ